jgi:nicotinamidase-related amidase
MPIQLKARYFRSVVDREGEVGKTFELLALNPSNTALLLVDVYSDVQDRDAVGDPKTHEAWRRAVGKASLALTAARKHELPIIYTANSSPRIALDRSEFGKHFQRSWGHDFDREFREGGVDEREYFGGRSGPLRYPPELEPRPGEYYLRKHTYSAFFDTRLDTLLRNLDIGTLIMAGFHADVCMLATSLDAFYRNYRVIWLRNATIGGIRDNQSRTEWTIDWLEDVIGYTVTAEEFAAACRGLDD